MHFRKEWKKNRLPIEQNGYLYNFIENYLTLNSLQHIQNKLRKGAHYMHQKHFRNKHRLLQLYGITVAANQLQVIFTDDYAKEVIC